jgi:hypothetical protein
MPHRALGTACRRVRALKDGQSHQLVERAADRCSGEGRALEQPLRGSPVVEIVEQPDRERRARVAGTSREVVEYQPAIQPVGNEIRRPPIAEFRQLPRCPSQRPLLPSLFLFQCDHVGFEAEAPELFVLLLQPGKGLLGFGRKLLSFERLEYLLGALQERLNFLDRRPPRQPPSHTRPDIIERAGRSLLARLQAVKAKACIPRPSR